MLIVFNIIIIGLVLLIAYWWANQGLFSALLHLVCVIAAGAVALSVWEPLTERLLLRGNGFDDYAWGVSLIGVFVITLLVLRVLSDKLIPSNVDLPHWANLTFGFPVGAAAGVLTVGLFVIGAGYIQSEVEVMGFVGQARSGRNAQIEQESRLWAPVHEWTDDFYSWLSVTSLSTNQPLRQYNPDLHFMAASLMRDSAKQGRGKLSLRPQDASISKFVYSPDGNRYAVTVDFDSGARDFGEQLTLSASQIRLIGAPPKGSTNEAKTAHPDQWTQYDGWHRFDDPSHYLTSEPAKTNTTAIIEFNARDLGNQTPAFVQIRGTRYRLPQPEQVRADQISEARSSAPTGVGGGHAVESTAISVQSALEQSNSIRPIQVSTNQMPAGISVNDDKFITGGVGEFLRNGGDRPARALLVKGIWEPERTRIVMVNVSRNSPASIFGNIQDRAGQSGELLLVDSKGNGYPPIGYIHERPDGITQIAVDYQNYYRIPGKLPSLPTSGDHVLKLLVSVTESATIVGFTYGNVTVGTCNLLVKDPKGTNKPVEPPSTPTAGDSRKKSE